MASREEVSVGVRLRNARSFQRDARSSANSVRGIGKEADKAGKNAKTANIAMRGLGAGLKGLGVGAAGAAVGVAGLAFVLGKKSVAAYAETRKIAAQTNAVIASTGGAAGVTADQVGNLATAISKKTGFDDEAIQSGENLLLTFTNLKNVAGAGNDIFNQTTQIMTDMSVALGQDTKGSAIQLGKALNDPIKGVTALSRVGVSFTQQQKDQIKTLVESGKTLDAQKLILGELNKEFGGSAVAQATATDKMKVAWGNVQEAIGKGLTPVVDLAADKLTKIAEDITPQLEGAGTAIDKIFKRKDLTLDAKVKMSWDALKQNTRPMVADLRRFFNDPAVKKAVDDFAAGTVRVMAKAIAGGGITVAKAFLNAGPVGWLLAGTLIGSKVARGIATFMQARLARQMGSALGEAGSKPIVSSAARRIGRALGFDMGGSMSGSLSNKFRTSVVRDLETNKPLIRPTLIGWGKWMGRIIGVAAGAMAVVLIADQINAAFGGGIDKQNQLSKDANNKSGNGWLNLLPQNWDLPSVSDLLHIPKIGGAHGGLLSLASGGPISVQDTVPAMLAPGEFIVRRPVVDRLGADFFSQMNRTGTVPRDARGSEEIIVHSHVNLDGREIYKSVSRVASNRKARA